MEEKINEIYVQLPLFMQNATRIENCVQTLAQTVAAQTTKITNIEQNVGSLVARVTALETNAVSGSCEQHTSHVTFSRTMTRTCVAQVVSLACAHHIPCVISMRSCCVFDSLRLLHFPLFAFHLPSYRPVFPPGHQLHLPRFGGQIPSALLLLMRTLALLPTTNLSLVMNQRLPHLGGY